MFQGMLVVAALLGAPAALEVRGIYGNPGAFWKAGARLDEYGVNAVFVHSGSITPELAARVRREGAKLYAEFATLNGRGYVDQHPEAWPVDASGGKAPAATWFMGACPTDPGFRAWRMKLLAELLERHAVDGVFMDYLHWHAQFEDPEPVLPETCFSESCLRAFSLASGVRVPSGSTAERARWILEHRDREWRAWRCSVIADWMKEIRAVIQARRPGILLGNYQCPWRDGDFGGARRRTLGLDLALIAPLVDVVSPMVYHRRMGRPAGWVGESVEWLARTVGKGPQIWPIVQAHGDPGRIDGAEFGEVMALGRSGGATGIQMFTAAAVAEDPGKMRVLRDLYMRWSK